MRFQKSIRGRLVLWLGLLLICILTGFGATAWQLHRVSRIQLIDEDLERRVDSVSRQFTGPPSHPMAGPRREPGREEGPDGPPGWPLPPERPPSRDRQEEMEKFKQRIIASRVGEVIEEMNVGPAYLAIWTREGALVSETTNAPTSLAFPQLSRPDTAFHVRERGTLREAFRFTEMGECVLVGRDIASDLHAMRGFAGWLILAGSGVLALGGWRRLDVRVTCAATRRGDQHGRRADRGRRLVTTH
jgi:two-component system OmpR family sensor kinase